MFNHYDQNKSHLSDLLKLVEAGGVYIKERGRPNCESILVKIPGLIIEFYTYSYFSCPNLLVHCYLYWYWSLNYVYC